MATITTDGQWDVGGLLLGPGTVYPIAGVIGLGVPETKTADVDFPTGDGGYSGPEWMMARDVQLVLGVDGDPDTSGYDNALALLAAAWAPGAALTTVRYRRFGQIRRFSARPRGLVIAWDDDFHLGAVKATGRLVAPDPVIYADTATTASGTGTVAVTNTGNRGVWPVLTVTGPSGTVTLRNDSDGGRQVVLAGLTGDAVVDFAARTVTVAGASQYQAVQPGSGWWRVQPGANSLVLSGASSVGVSFRAGRVSG